MFKYPLLLIMFFTYSQLLFADSCKTQEPTGIGITQLAKQYSSDLSIKSLPDMLDRAEVLAKSELNSDKIAALLLLHEIQKGSEESEVLADSLVLLNKLRASVVRMLQYWPHSKCHEFKAARDYVNKYPVGYRGAEIWGSWVYEPVEFIKSSIREYTQENRVKIEFITYQEVDPCDPYQYDNSCYAPTFSKIADESENTEIWRDALFTAVIFNLDLSTCEFATAKERELGFSAVKKHAKILEETFPKSDEFSKVKKLIALHSQKKYNRKEQFSSTCRNHNDN